MISKIADEDKETRIRTAERRERVRLGHWSHPHQKKRKVAALTFFFFFFFFFCCDDARSDEIPETAIPIIPPQDRPVPISLTVPTTYMTKAFTQRLTRRFHLAGTHSCSSSILLTFSRLPTALRNRGDVFLGRHALRGPAVWPEGPFGPRTSHLAPTSPEPAPFMINSASQGRTRISLA